MNFVNGIALVISGALIVSSIILSRLGLIKSSISYRTAVIISGVGVGIGIGLYIYFGISNANFMESVITAMIVGVVAAFAFHTYSKLR